MKVLIVMAGFLPGKNYGGPPVSVDNFCSLMTEYECYILTVNHDMNATEPYPGIRDGWNDRGNCKVLYVSDERFQYRTFEAVMREISPDVLYLQGLFQSCVFPCLRLAKKLGIHVFLAPRGELCAGAFRKKYKKLPYLFLLKHLGLLQNAVFQSTSDDETAGIQKCLHVPSDHILSLTNIPSIPKKKCYGRANKEPGTARLIYLSRIVRKKNLLFGLTCLQTLHGRVKLDVYGPIEDRAYWDKCRELADRLPTCVNVTYCGLLEHDQVHQTFSAYDAFLFPTLSENFGHVIAEALSVGCPVILSDQTPFNDVEQNGAGWALPLNDPNRFSQILQQVIDRNAEEQQKASKRAREYIDTHSKLNELHRNYAVSFERVTQQKQM